MRLPGGEHAIIPIAKLTEYCLNPEHPTGKHKARVFRSALDIGLEDVDELRLRLAQAAVEEDVITSPSNRHGQPFVLDFEWTRRSRTATIRSSWIILNEEQIPRLITCYVTKERK